MLRNSCKLLRNSCIIRKFHKNSVILNAATSNSEPERTALYDFHVHQNGKMVNFAGFLLPVQYSDMGIAASHLHTRQSSSIFDVSHMLQTHVRGKDVIECIESICTADIRGLLQNSGSLTVFTNDEGNILDDLIVSKISDNHLYIVSNAAMKTQDMKIIADAVSKFKALGKDVSVEFLTPNDRSLLALQGPKSCEALQAITKKIDLSKLYFMNTITSNVAGIEECRITRCGYTGEDGFEISVPAEKSVNLVESLLSYENSKVVKMAGLGARDSLRLEAGLCLYGSDIDAKTTPVEAALAWLVSKRRRSEGNFPGAVRINEQLKTGTQSRRVGIRMSTGPPARHDVEIFNMNNEKIGQVTSGCPSPSLGGNVAMGYVLDAFKKHNTKIQLKIRDKLHPAEITKMPFVPSKYFTRPKNS